MLLANDIYKVQINFSLDATELTTLFSLYQSCVTPLAINLYLTLSFDKRCSLLENKHQYLCELMNVNIIEIEKAREKLERYNLIKTYYKKDNGYDRYIYELLPPLKPLDFLQHDVYGRAYCKIVGMEQYRININLFTEKNMINHDYLDISKSFDLKMLNSWDQELEIKFNDVKKIDFDELNSSDCFDINRFIADSSSITFPLAARTQENLQLIVELANIYGLDEIQMKKLVGRAVNLSNNSLDINKLKYYVSNEASKEKNIDDEYQLAPIVFLKHKQNGIEPVARDKKLIETLSLKYNLKNEIMNCLIEFALNNDNQQLRKIYLEQLIGILIRNKVFDKDSAIKALNKSRNIYYSSQNHNNRIASIPEYVNNPYNRDDEEELEFDIAKYYETLNKIEE